MIPDLENSKHILLRCSSNSFAVASILYTYLLTQHKKVSMCGEAAQHFAFLPWYEMLRREESSSADTFIECDTIDVAKLYRYFKEKAVKINKKMATSFYAAYLHRYRYCLSIECDGMVFAELSEIIGLGAQYKEVRQRLLCEQPLSLFRLRSYLYRDVVLEENAECAVVSVSDAILAKTGSSLQDVEEILTEFLLIAHVKKVILQKSDDNNRIIKVLKDNESEK